MGILGEWVRNIFLVVAAVSFIQLLFPGGEMGKYLKFVLSLVILGIIIYPFAALFA